MEQQQPCQQDHLSGQQVPVQQQVMFCPIRVVYDPVVQSGEQLQPNQIFINPQNPPPWVRPVQNQVIYLQQVPNIMPVPQQMEQQMYVPQYYQQMQPMVQNIPDQRYQPMMIQNVHEGVINYGQIQPNVINMTSLAQNQIANREIVNIQNANQIANQNAANQRAAELQQQAMFRNMVPQLTQQARPQMPILMNQLQNVNVQNLPTGIHTFAPIRQTVPMQVQHVANIQNAGASPNTTNKVENVRMSNVTVQTQNAGNVDAMRSTVENASAQTDVVSSNLHLRAKLGNAAQAQSPNQFNQHQRTVTNAVQTNNNQRPNLVNASVQVKTTGNLSQPSRTMTNIATAQNVQKVNQIPILAKAPVPGPTMGQMNQNVRPTLNIETPQNTEKVNQRPTLAPIQQTIVQTNQMSRTMTNSAMQTLNAEKINQRPTLAQPYSPINLNQRAIMTNASAQTNTVPNRNIKPNVANQNPNLRAALTNSAPTQQTQTTNVNQIMLPNQKVKLAEALASKANRAKTPTENTVTYSAVRNGQSYSYRAIQPKTSQSKPVLPNMPTLTPRPVFPTNYSSSMPPLYPSDSTAMPSTSYVKTDNISRKRKSESPDEIQRKIATNQVVIGSMTVTPKLQNTTRNDTSTMSAQTSQEDVKPTPDLTINPMPEQASGVKTETKETNQSITRMDVDSEPVALQQKTEQRTDKDKLIRNTVYTQARGRLLNDKQNDVKTDSLQNENQINKQTPIKHEFEGHEKRVKANESPAQINVAPVEKVKSENPCVTNDVKPKINDLKPDMVCSRKTRANMRPCTSTNVNNLKVKAEDIKPEPNTNIVSESSVKTKPDQTDMPSETADIKKDKKEYKNLSANDITGKEIQIVGGHVVKEERDFVLTHVLDGFVIQESNVPFAIRKPLRERIVNVDSETQEQKDMKVDPSKEVKDVVIKDNSKILDLSHLHLNEGQITDMINEAKELGQEKDTPFGELTQDTVKSWTCDQLTTHLSKYNWIETVNLLREHEIDGESLFLVTKPQLVAIGIGEEHSDVICEFIKT